MQKTVSDSRGLTGGITGPKTFRARLRSRLTQNGRKSLGQSFVEFAILLPVLLMMLSGLIEFGFMLNTYLDLIDSAREVARYLANDDPLHNATGGFEPSSTASPEPYDFYHTRARNLMALTLANSGGITLDSFHDNMIVSVFVVHNNAVTERYPSDYGDNGWPLYPTSTHHTSEFTKSDITAKLSGLANTPPDTGLVMVEIFYDYHMVMGLPWIRVWVPDPVTLHAYSIMPNPNAAPTPTP
jgi:Flp pilus assembly protein TadG